MGWDAENKAENNLSNASATNMSFLSNRFSIIFFVALLLISTAILMVASTADTPEPGWGAYVDVGIVVLIAMTGLTVHRRNKATPGYDLSHEFAIYLVPLLLVDMGLRRESLDFNILLPGVAWRVYFLHSILPHVLSLWNSQHQ